MRVAPSCDRDVTVDCRAPASEFIERPGGDARSTISAASRLKLPGMGFPAREVARFKVPAA